METTADLTLDAPAAPSRAALWFIFATVTLDMLAFGIIGPVLPKLVLGFVGGEVARASEVFGIFATAWAVMQFFCSPLLGALSDRFGRRPVIVLSSLGLGLDYVVMALAPNLAWLFIGRVVSGITSASVATASAYIADVTPPEKRAGAFGMIGSAFGLGFILGPAIGGLLGGADPRLPFWVSAGFSLLNAAFGFFVLRESLPASRRAAFSWQRANPLGSLALLRSHHELFGLASVTFLSNLAGIVMPTIWVLYVAYRYGWDTRAVGLSLAAVGVTSMALGPFTHAIVKRLGERRALLAGLVSAASGTALMGLGPTGWMFGLGILAMSLWGLAPSATQSLMTRRVSPSEQGQLQGALGSLRGIATLVGPGMFSLTFAASIGVLRSWNLPGAAWLLACVLLIAAMSLAYAVTRSSPAGSGSEQAAPGY
ncbi:MAG: tetA [Candidatus Eremiobacteraeota bacterium]|nr:tetA [Candidatus Eremiobacteraeota bacterium]